MNKEVDSRNWDDHLVKTVERWMAPGLAVTILKDNEILYSKGFGYRDIDKKLEMTRDTMQPIASCSKSFTSTAVAMLVDEGKLEWNTPVYEYIPQFKLKDQTASKQVTISDLLSHRTGLPRHDFVWVDDQFKYSWILERLPHLELSTGVRQTLQYCNLTFIAASIIIEELSGRRFSDFISKHIFKPLGMKNSNYSVNETWKTQDFAKPYKIDFQSEKFRLIDCDYVVYDSLVGAGGINSSAYDVGKWLKFHLNKGKVGTRQLVTQENLRMTYTQGLSAMYNSESMQGILRKYYPYQTWFRNETWALGWMNQMYRGYNLIAHPGGLDGSTSFMTFLPDENVGVFAITNQSDSRLPFAVVYHLIDDVLDLEPVDWNSILYKIESQMNKVYKETEEHSKLLQKQNAVPTHDPHEFTGKYRHPGYGLIEFYIDKGHLKMKYGSAHYPLSHFHYNTYQFELTRWDTRERLTFQVDSLGDVSGVSVKLEELLPPILFKKLPEDQLREKKFLESLLGKYDLAGQIVEIRLKDDDTIIFAHIEQPGVELEPVKDLRFKSKDSDLINLFFKIDDEGKVSGFTYVAYTEVIPALRIDQT
jgi:CubicO group peptidase (beta-lactamase class C family)